MRQGVDDETIARLLKIAAQRKGLSTPEEERAYAEKIVQRVRAERQKRLRELGLDPDEVDKLPRKYQYPGD